MSPLYDDLCFILLLKTERWLAVMSKTLLTPGPDPDNDSAS